MSGVRPGPRIARAVAGRTLVLLAALVLIALGVDRVESSTLGPNELARLLGPLAAAGGAALTVAVLRDGGDWDGWTGLGYSPRALATGSLILLAAVGLLHSALPASHSAGRSTLELPAPVAANVGWWWAEGGWTEADLASWRTPPARLSTPALLARSRREAPAGARRGVDRAELLRRVGWGVAWPLAGLLGFFFALRAPRPRVDAGRRLRRLLTASGAAGGVSLWLLLVLCAAAYSASIT